MDALIVNIFLKTLLLDWSCSNDMRLSETIDLFHYVDVEDRDPMKTYSNLADVSEKHNIFKT